MKEKNGIKQYHVHYVKCYKWNDCRSSSGRLEAIVQVAKKGRAGGCACVFVHESIYRGQPSPPITHAKNLYCVIRFGQPLNENLQPNEPLTVVASKMGISFLLSSTHINMPNTTVWLERVQKQSTIKKWAKSRAERERQRASKQWGTEMNPSSNIHTHIRSFRCVSVALLCVLSFLFPQ